MSPEHLETPGEHLARENIHDRLLDDMEPGQGTGPTESQEVYWGIRHKLRAWRERRQASKEYGAS